MQKSRRWRGLELDLLSLVVASLAACSSTPTASSPPASSANEASSASPASHTPPLADTSASQPVLAPGASDPSSNPAPMPKGTRVLQIGDSFADALGGKLSKLLRDAEVK